MLILKGIIHSSCQHFLNTSFISGFTKLLNLFPESSFVNTSCNIRSEESNGTLSSNRPNGHGNRRRIHRLKNPVISKSLSGSVLDYDPDNDFDTESRVPEFGQRNRNFSLTPAGISGSCPLLIGAVAQMGERMTGSHEVRGSIPLSSTTQTRGRSKRLPPFLYESGQAPTCDFTPPHCVIFFDMIDPHTDCRASEHFNRIMDTSKGRL